MSLDRTAFYRRAAGRPSDQGSLTLLDGPLVGQPAGGKGSKERSGEVLHFLDPAAPPCRRPPTGARAFDWERRYRRVAARYRCCAAAILCGVSVAITGPGSPAGIWSH